MAGHFFPGLYRRPQFGPRCRFLGIARPKRRSFFWLVTREGLEISVTDTTNMMRMLLEDEVHLGVGFHPVSHPQIVSRYRAAVPLMAVMNSAHRLAQRASLTMGELCAESLALMGPHFRIRQMIDEAAANNGLIISPSFVSNSIALLARMALANRTITVLPAFSVSAELDKGDLAAVSIEAPQLQAVFVHLLARRSRRFPPYLNDLADQIRYRLLSSSSVGKRPAHPAQNL